jgi:nitrate reductase (NAD(P)H)
MATFPNELLQQYTTFLDPVEHVDSRDENTADSHVKRDPSMLRLTGKHPFNAGKNLFMASRQC